MATAIGMLPVINSAAQISMPRPTENAEAFVISSDDAKSATAAPIFTLPLGSYDAASRCFLGDSDSDSAAEVPTAKITGFFQADATWSDFDISPSIVSLGRTPEDVYDIRGFRRARLAAVGSTAENVDFMVEFDFAFPGRPTFMDLFFDIKDTAWGTVRVGQWRQPFGLGELTSVKSLTFHERASMFFLGPFRKTGIGIQNSDQRSTYAFSLFGGTIDNVPDQFGTSLGDSNYGFAGR